MQSFIIRLLMWVLLGAMWSHTNPTLASIFVVTNTQTGGPGSFADAVAQATESDTIDARGVQGVIKLDTTLMIDEDMVIWGPGADRLSLDGQDQVRHFWIIQFDSLYLEGFTLVNGNADGDSIQKLGGSIFSNGKLEAVNCVFRNNKAINGGAIFNAGGGGFITRAWFRNCSFFRNQASLPPVGTLINAGGALSGDSRGGGVAKFWAYNTTFSENEAIFSGGAIFLIADPVGGSRFEGLNCTIANNVSGRSAGIDNSLAEICVLKNSILANNQSAQGFGDLFGTLRSKGHILIGDDQSANWDPLPTSSDLVNVDPGLGPLANNGSPMYTHSLLCGSPAIDAGDDTDAPLTDLRGQNRVGVSDIGAHERNESIDLAITHTGEEGLGSLHQAILLACPDETLFADQIQGTIYLTSPILIDKNLQIEGNPNQAVILNGNLKTRLLVIEPGAEVSLSWMTLRKGAPDVFGGGAIQNRGSLNLSHITLQDNQAESGGAIANYGNLGPAILNLTNCTLSNNQAWSLDGGAIDNRPFTFGAISRLQFCTIANNLATNKGGGIYNEAEGVVEMRNTLLGENQAPIGPDLFGIFASQGYNLVSNSQDANLGSTTGDLLNQASNLDVLANYGGPTFTHRLLAGSPAIDAGSNMDAPPTDQRGENRNFNGIVDIGAYEYDPATSLAPNPAREVQVFPNPTSGLLHIKLPHSEVETEVSLLDLNGKLLLGPHRMKDQLILDLHTLASGMYLLLFDSGDSRWSKKLVLW